MSNKRGKIVIVTAPSGAGKTTMTRRLLRRFDNLKFSTSATTRPPRTGEIDGRDYYFLSPDEFQAKIDNGEFLEWEEFYNGTRYGTLRSDIEKQREKGYFVLLDIDVLGAVNVKRMFGDDVLSIFIAPPSMDILKERLMKRATESADTIQTRLERAKEELAFRDKFDLTVVNDELETAYKEIETTVKTFINI